MDGIDIRRDGAGIPHIEAASERDAWFGLGYAAACDRLWQMEYDRRRATGRWAEVVGEEGLGADRLARRLDLTRAARTTVSAMPSEVREVYEAYAAGVNAGAAASELPPEYAAAGIGFEPWEPWHSVAAFAVRHVLMGPWQSKLAKAVLVAREGIEAYAGFVAVPKPGFPVTVPSGARLAADDPRVAGLLERAGAEIAEAAAELGFLAEVEAGSNAWAVSGSRTTTGLPVLCNDSHRALDVPNVYWQAHLRCPAFDVRGATFPGFPGFPHFGHNGTVGWAITHAAADTQDLYVEEFSGGSVRTPEGWQEVSPRTETIRVAGGSPVVEECWATPNGPVVHGDPRTGRALSLRWTVLQQVRRDLGVPLAMLRARSVRELLDAQHPWVDPVNNLVAADVHGTIGYLLRGALPRRRSPASTYLPVPGWLPESAWLGTVPFGQLPRMLDPANGVIVTSNNVVSADPVPLVSHSPGDHLRSERIHELLASRDRHTPSELAAFQMDVTSVAARAWARLLARRGPYEPDSPAESARKSIVATDGRLDGGSREPLVYACFRKALIELLLAARLGPGTVRFLLEGPIPATSSLVARWLAGLIWPDGPGQAAPAANLDDDVLREALASAWREAADASGWAEVHQVTGRHTLARPDWDPPPAGVGGDNDTVQMAAYEWARSSGFTVAACAVYRQVLDLADLASSRWVIPGGASGRPGHPHYADQLPLWAQGRYLPMSPPEAELVTDH